jgi:hypothetical protein
VLLLLALAFAAPLPHSESGPAITAARSERVALTFTARGLDVTQTTRARLEHVLSRTHGFYEHGLGVSYPEQVPLHVTVYGDRADYDAARTTAGAPSWAGGWFTVRAGKPEAHVWDHGSTDAMVGVFLHEAAHWLLRYAGRPPRWLDEGLAQCFGHASVRGNLLTVEPPEHFLAVLKDAGPPSVSAIVGSTSGWEELPADRVGPLYVQGWALTAFLLSSEAGQRTLAEIVARTRRDGSASQAVAAVDDTWRGGMDGLQRDLERWLSNPPAAVPIPRYQRTPAPASDGMWTNCGDGRLVSAAIGCDVR